MVNRETYILTDSSGSDPFQVPFICRLLTAGNSTNRSSDPVVAQRTDCAEADSIMTLPLSFAAAGGCVVLGGGVRVHFTRASPSKW